MRAIRPREADSRLFADGENVASILRRITKADDPELLERITVYLAHILPGLQQIRVEDLRGYDLLTLRQRFPNGPGWWDAQPDQISDGTLRALGVLVALFQGRLGGKSETSLVGIEEPETGLHPGVAGALLDALSDASQTTQVLVTTHSSALLDSDDVDVDSLLAVVADDGITQIGPIGEVGRSILRDRLFTAGELLQMEQLRPGPKADGHTQPAGSPVAATPG
jgi:predicted ATPase